jgi:hypothetical protein
MAGFVDKLAQDLGYQRYRNTAYGRTNGIFFNVVPMDTGSVALYGAVGAQAAGQSNMPTVRAFVKREGGIDMIGVNAFLKRKWKGFKIYNIQADGVSVWMNINNAWTLKAENVEALLLELSAYLAQNGYTSGCSLCTATEGLGYTEQDGRVMEVCEACHARLQNAVEDIRAERETTGSYAKGALGAVLGGIIGIIPWVVIGLIGYVAAISGLIMAWLSYKGYQMAGGRKGRGMVWILVVVLVVFTYVGVIASLYANIAADGFEMVDNAFLIVLTLPFIPGEDVGAVWGQLALGWLFAGLGSFSLIRKANREGAGKDLAVQRINKEQQ